MKPMAQIDAMLKKQYSGRPADVVVLNFCIHKDALEILGEYCPPGRKSHGQFLSRLLFEHHARMQERQRLKESVTAVLDGGQLVTEDDAALATRGD